VRSINYSEKEVALSVVDPLNRSNHGGGDSLNPYSMGGTICCFAVPSEWHAGYQVIVEYNFYPDPAWHTQLVDVPPYPGGVAGDIWLTMHEDGRVEAIVSSFGPTRPEWPGRVKGLPVQSPEYTQKIRNKWLKNKKGILEKMEQGLLDGTERSPEQVARLKSSIEHTREQIRQMEEAKP
jgi:hypothetical protein